MVSEPPLGERRVLAKRKALLRNSQVGAEDNWKKAEWGWSGGSNPRPQGREDLAPQSPLDALMNEGQ